MTMSQPQQSQGTEVEDVQEKLSSTALVKSGTSSTCDWIANTGATDHMSPTDRLFKSYSSPGRAHKVQTAGGGILSVLGVGDVCLSPLGTLKEFLHVENLRANLISI